MKTKIPLSQYRASARGIYVVWLRHLRRYKNSWKVNCIPPISEPLVYLVAFGYGMGPLVGSVEYKGESFDYFEFIAPGMIAVGILFQAFFECAYGTYIRIRYQQLWQSLLTAPISYAEIFFGDLFWGMTRGILSGVLTALTASALGVYPLVAIFYLLPVIILGSLLFAAIGMVAASLVNAIDQLNVPVFLLIVPMFVFCGTYFPRTTLPDGIQLIAEALPLAALVDLMRWPLVKPDNWILLILILVFWTVIASIFAIRKLSTRVFS